MAAMAVGSSGRSSGEKRAATLALRSMRNFSKFQRMPGSGLVEAPLWLFLRKLLRFSRKLSRVGPMALGWAATRDWYRGWVLGPVTGIFENRGKSTPKGERQKVWMCSLEPGCWAPKSLAGDAATTNPESLKRG